MTKATRKFITTLRQQYKAADYKSRQEIWDILTALRGPDYDTLTAWHKEATTAVVRQKLFTKKLAKLIPAVVNPDAEYLVKIRTAGQLPYHFGHHARVAFKALGLKWDKVNK